MNDKSRNILRLIVGGYLIYLGGSLFMDVLKEKPNNYVLFLIAGVFFIAVGGIIIFLNLKSALHSSTNTEEESEEEENEDNKIEEITDRQDSVGKEHLEVEDIDKEQKE
ncbi:hypothetical protein ACTQ6A_13675 [Lachnospiraceae bacterium LCP25S3_G4]